MNQNQYEDTLTTINRLRRMSVKDKCNSKVILEIDSLLLNFKLVLTNVHSIDGIYYAPTENICFGIALDSEEKEGWLDFVTEYRRVPTEAELYKYMKTGAI